MPLTPDFDLAALGSIADASLPSSKGTSRRGSPFSIRLSEAERARLLREAGGMPLGTYVKSKVLGTSPERTAPRGLAVQDRLALAKVLAILGRSDLSSSLTIIAEAASTGSLLVSPELESEILLALQDVRTVRVLVMRALGLRPEDQP